MENLKSKKLMATLGNGFKIVFASILSMLSLNKERSLISDEGLEILSKESDRIKLDSAIDRLKEGGKSEEVDLSDRKITIVLG